MQVFILYWGGEEGSREDCSIFYTNCEVWKSRPKAVERAAELTRLNAAGLDNDDENAVDNFYTHIVPATVKS